MIAYENQWHYILFNHKSNALFNNDINIFIYLFNYLYIYLFIHLSIIRDSTLEEH